MVEKVKFYTFIVLLVHIRGQHDMVVWSAALLTIL